MRERPMKPLFKILFVLLILIGILCVGCDLVRYTGEEPPYPNKLSTKDSLAVRAILDANGLDTVKVHDIVSFFENSNYIASIRLSSFSLKRFVFSKYFDSLALPLSYLGLQNNQIDTLIIHDSINSSSANSYFTIYLQHNNLRVIPNDIKNIKNTLELYLDYNQIRTLSDSIVHCNISYIHVDYNSLCNIPDSIAQWITKNCRDSTWKTTQTCN